MKRRVLTLALALCILLSLCPASYAITASAASQVYYKIDFSDAVLASGIGQRVDGDCAVVSMATVESYLYGAKTQAEKNKIYDAVVSANKDNDYAYWSNVGYVRASYGTFSLTKLYEQLAQGYPVLVHRTEAGGGEHWSVVCGYNGSTSKLEQSGFIVVNVAHGGTYGKVSKQTLSKWVGTGTLDNYARRKNGLAFTGFDGIHFAVNYPELVHPYGSGHGVYGQVVSNQKLTSVKVWIVKAADGSTVYSYSGNPNAKSWTPYNLDSKMTFASWGKGKYYYVIGATDASGSTKYYAKYFTIDSSWPSSAPSQPVYTIAYDANGGSGSMAGSTIRYFEYLTPAAATFTREGYAVQGWTVRRGSDGKWATASGWKTEAEISSGNLEKKVYTSGTTYLFDSTWLSNGGSGACTYTFYAIWEKMDYTLTAYDNFSGKNYLSGTDFETIDETTLSSRDTDSVKISVDAGNTHNSYNSLKIDALTAGGQGKDLRIQTMTNNSATRANGVGDEKTMTLSFWAKSSVEGNTFNIRWGWEALDEYRTVTLTTSWAFYTIDMSKTTGAGYALHPYIGQAGTVWIAEMQLEDGAAATEFVPESGNYQQIDSAYGGSYNLPTAPERDGYEFAGWYTAASGGEEITSATAVLPGNLMVYAHWTKADTPHTHHYTDKVTAPTCTEQGYTTHTCACGESYVDSYVSALGHAWNDGVVTEQPTQTTDGVKTFTCTRCGATKTESIPATGDQDDTPCDGGESCPSANFVDVNKNQWYHEGIDFAVSNGLFNGVSKTEFEPDEPMTRAMLVTVLWRLDGKPEPAGSNPFSDVKNGEWFTDAIIWASENGIVNGVGNGKFEPEECVTREQMATILHRYAVKKGYDVSATTDISSYPDASSVNGWARDALVWANAEGLINGTTFSGRPGTWLDPQGSATRAQVATILMRFVKNVAA